MNNCEVQHVEEGLQRVSHVVQIVKPLEATCAFGLYEYLTWLIWTFELYSVDKLLYCLFQNKIEGTIWKEIDDLKVFKVMDLEEFQQTFSAYQKPQVQFDTLILSVSHSRHTFISNNDTDLLPRSQPLHYRVMWYCCVFCCFVTFFCVLTEECWGWPYFCQESQRAVSDRWSASTEL